MSQNICVVADDTDLQYVSANCPLDVRQIFPNPFHCTVTNNGISCIRLLSRLEDLSLAELSVADDWLPPLADLTTVQRLYLNGTMISAVGLKHLQGWTSLKALRLKRAPNIKDDALAIISRFTKLEELDLTGTGTSDSGLLTLNGLGFPPLLATLMLTGTKVTDAGLMLLVKALPKLKTLGIKDTAVTAQVRKRLHPQLILC